MKPTRGHTITACGVAALALFLPPADDLSAGPAALQQQLIELEAGFLEHANADRHDEAMAVLGRMVDLDAQHPKIFFLAARLYLPTKEFDRAFDLMRSLVQAGPGLSYGRGVLDTYRQTWDDAETAYREALEGYEASAHLAGQASSQLMLGYVLRHQERWDESARALGSARSLFEQLEDRSGVASALSNMGQLEGARGRTDKALDLLAKTALLQRQLGDREREAQAWMWLGKTHRKVPDDEAAVAAFLEALALRRQTGDDLGQYGALLDLGKAYGRLDQTELAIGAWREALVVAESIGSPSRLAIALMGLGHALLRSGQLDAAADALQSALELTTSPGVTASALQSLAEVHLSAGALTQALAAQQRALDLARELKRKNAVQDGLNRLAAIHLRLGNPMAARRLIDEALALARQAKNAEAQARARHNLGVLLLEEGRLESALQHLLASIELCKELEDGQGVAFGRFNTSETLWRMDRREEATRLLDQALAGLREARDLEGEVLALNLAGDFRLRDKRYDDALDVYARALELSRQHGFQRSLWTAHAGRAATLEASGRLEDAAVEYANAIAIIESLRADLETGEFKMRFFASKAEVYERAVALQARLHPAGGSAAAFRLAEQARARSLLDLLAESRTSPRGILPTELAERERTTIEEVGVATERLARASGPAARETARQELERAGERLQLLKLEIRRAAPSYSEVAYPQASELREIQVATLRENEILLRYFFGEEYGMLWEVDRETVRFQRLQPRTEIAKLVEAFLDRAGRATLTLGGDPPGLAEAEALTEALGIRRYPDGRRLIVVPDGPLHHLPFEVLRQDGRYLIQDHEIAVVPSATTLKWMREHPGETAAGGFLGIGGVDSSGDPRSPALPHSDRALDRIAAMFAENNRVVLKGNTSTKDSILGQPLDQFRHVHFATHGRLVADSPRHVGLRVSPATEGGDDDFLYVDDVLSARFGADLVVLSACSSGLGELLPGEGLVGLTRAFLYAGAHSLIVTLWNVNDRSTAEFMEAFYTELSKGRNVHDALRRTKLAFIASDRPAQRQPYRWAPFVLVGDPAGIGLELNPPAPGPTQPVTGTARSHATR